MAKYADIAKIAKDELGPIVEGVEPERVAKNILERVQSGKQLREFTADDWMAVFEVSADDIVWDKAEEKLRVAFSHEQDAEGIAKALASSMKKVQSHYTSFRAGEISEADFLYESEWACLDAVVSILASYLRLCPIEVKSLGIVISDEVLKVRYAAVKDDIRGEWEDTLARHAEQQRTQDEALEKKHSEYIRWLEDDLDEYMKILPRAFSDDPAVALAGSAELALFMKLPEDEVLTTTDDVDSFFLS